MCSTSYILLHRYNIIIIVDGERQLYYFTIGLAFVCLRGSNTVPWSDSTDFECYPPAGTLFSANTCKNTYNIITYEYIIDENNV